METVHEKIHVYFTLEGSMSPDTQSVKINCSLFFGFIIHLENILISVITWHLLSITESKSQCVR